jgi:hypothetical protein
MPKTDAKRWVNVVTLSPAKNSAAVHCNLTEVMIASLGMTRISQRG